jgi:hypothetical protein
MWTGLDRDEMARTQGGEGPPEFPFPQPTGPLWPRPSGSVGDLLGLSTARFYSTWQNHAQ